MPYLIGDFLINFFSVIFVTDFYLTNRGKIIVPGENITINNQWIISNQLTLIE